MINITILVGRLTRNIEVRYTSNNKAVGNFTLAVNRKFKDSKGNYPTDFIDCVIFGKSAEILSKYTQKGDLIGIEGSIQKRQYEDKEGNKHYITEIMVEKYTFLSQNKKQEEATNSYLDDTPMNNPYKDMSVKVEQEHQFEITDSDLPF